ncbi:hypothetical protein PJM53_29045, partial [Mycobacterium kansasii]
HRVAAGKALQAMRLRGESVSAIAAQTGMSLGRVREFLRVAADAETGKGEVSSVGVAQVVRMPNQQGLPRDGQEAAAAIAGTQ